MNNEFNSNNSAAVATQIQQQQQQQQQLPQQQTTQNQQMLQQTTVSSSVIGPQAMSGNNFLATNTTTTDLTPPKQNNSLSRTRYNNPQSQQQQQQQQNQNLLKQMNSPIITSSDQQQQQQQQQILGSMQQQLPASAALGNNFQSHQQPQQLGNNTQQNVISPLQGPSTVGGAFDQNTYMQLLQRQSQMGGGSSQMPQPRSGMVQGPRPQSRNRVGGDIFAQVIPQQPVGGNPNQTLNPAATNNTLLDQSLLIQPNQQQTTAGTVNNMNFGQPQPNNTNPASAAANVQQQIYLQSLQQQQLNNTRTATQIGGGPNTTQNFLNQTINGDLMQQQQQQPYMFRNQQQQPQAQAAPMINQQPQQPQQQQQQQPFNMDQLQFITQLIQQQAQMPFQQHPQLPQQTFDQQQLIQQLLFQQTQQQQPNSNTQAQQTQVQQQQQTAPTPQQAQISTRNNQTPHFQTHQPNGGVLQPQANLSIPQMMYQSNTQFQQAQPAGQQQNNNNPQLQQISENVNQYRRLVENYKNSNTVPNSSKQQMAMPQQIGTNNFDNTGSANNLNERNNMIIQQSQQNDHQSATPSYESFLASQQFTLGGPANGSNQGSGQNQRRTPSIQTLASHDGMGVPKVNQNSGRSMMLNNAGGIMNDSGDGNNNSAGGNNNGQESIAWPSHNVGRGVSTNSRPDRGGNSGDKQPQFQSEDDNSAFLEGKLFLGALNGNPINNTETKLQQADIGSKSLSPIAQNKNAAIADQDLQNNYSSSFLKSGNEEMINHEASQVVNQNGQGQNKENEDDDGQDGICWISQLNKENQQIISIKDESLNNQTTNNDLDQDNNNSNQLVPKQLFSENTTNQDIDAQVIRKQEKTFEEMLESQLQKDGKPSLQQKAENVEEVAVVVESTTTAPPPSDVLEMHTTPIKVKDDEKQHSSSKDRVVQGNHPRKAFLRRGSSSKYDPQQARKQSQGSTKKFKYYTDNFSNQKKQQTAAPKGTSGIPQLSAARQNEQASTAAASEKINSLGSPRKHQYNSNSKKNTVDKKASKTLNKDQNASPEKFDKPDTEQTRANNGSISSTGRLKPPASETMKPPNSSRLKFNPPASTAKASSNQPATDRATDSKAKKEPKTSAKANEAKKSAEEKKTTVGAQKATSNRLATNSKQLFRKTNANSTSTLAVATLPTSTKQELKSTEGKDPSPAILPLVIAEAGPPSAQTENNAVVKKPRETVSAIIVLSDSASSTQTPHIQLESSMCDDPEDSFCEKNSIAEFEMLEKECFQDEVPQQVGANTAQQSKSKPQKQVAILDLKKVANRKTPSAQQVTSKRNESKVQIIHDSPVRKSAREILNNLKSASADEQSEDGKLDKLEQQLLNLIAEQELEVNRLKEENLRVAVLQSECQKQLERLNKEAQDQEKVKKVNQGDLKKLKSQLKVKEEEIIKLEVSLLTQKEQNSKLQSNNQSLSGKVNQMSNAAKTKKKEATKETQTEKTLTRNVMVGTQGSVQTADQEVQVELLVQDSPEKTIDCESDTPQKDEQSHFTLEENKSLPVSVDDSVREETNEDLDPRDLTLSGRQIGFTDESCDLKDNDTARGQEVLKSARMPSSPGDTFIKTSKIVTFNLNESVDQKQQAATTQSQMHDESANFEDIIREEELQAEHIDEHPLGTDEDHVDQDQDQDVEEDNDEEEEEEEREEYDLVFPEKYHSDEAYKNLEQVDEVVSSEGKKQKFYKSGKKEIIFPNGVKREVWPDGYQVVFFQNQDIKQTFPGGKIVYFFSQAKTTQTTFPDGLQVFKFQNNQIEKHFPDGTKEISFPDGTVKCLFSDGEEESIFPDGTIQKIEKTGLRIIEYSHGQRDYMYPDGTKVREYPNGTIKRYNLDGTVESITQNDITNEALDQEGLSQSEMPQK